jgi:hypothetical protein
VQNTVELRVTHDVEIFGRTQSLCTDVYPAHVPGFVEFKIEDVPEVQVTPPATAPTARASGRPAITSG